MREFICTFIEDRRDQWRDRSRRIKAAKISRVFKREGGLIGCSLTSAHERICNHPGRCATGALLHAAGVPDEELLKHGAPSDAFFNILRDVYGLTHRESMSLLDANDGSILNDVWAKCGVDPHRALHDVRVCVVRVQLSRLVRDDHSRHPIATEDHRHSESLGA